MLSAASAVFVGLCALAGATLSPSAPAPPPAKWAQRAGGKRANEGAGASRQTYHRSITLRQPEESVALLRHNAPRTSAPRLNAVNKTSTFRRRVNATATGARRKQPEESVSPRRNALRTSAPRLNAVNKTSTFRRRANATATGSRRRRVLPGGFTSSSSGGSSGPSSSANESWAMSSMLAFGVLLLMALSIGAGVGLLWMISVCLDVVQPAAPQ